MSDLPCYVLADGRIMVGDYLVQKPDGSALSVQDTEMSAWIVDSRTRTATPNTEEINPRPFIVR